MAPKKEMSGPSKASKDRAVRATRRELAKQTPVAMETKRARLETSSSSNLDNDQDGDIDHELEIDDLLAASSMRPPPPGLVTCVFDILATSASLTMVRC